MDNRYIFAAVKGLVVEVEDMADGTGSIKVRVKLDEPHQYISREELKEFGELVEKHIINLREDIISTVQEAINLHENGDVEIGERLEDSMLEITLRPEDEEEYEVTLEEEVA